MGPLYQDFADEFMPHRHPSRALDWRDISNVDYDIPDDVDVHVKPHKQYKVPEQDFIKFGSYPIEEFTCLVHARHMGRGSGKNYPQELWETVVSMLPGSIASIGTAQDLHIAGSRDLRDIPLDMLMNTMAGSSVVIGGSSGVMHLATLCDVPVVVWFDSRTYFGETLEKRYKETWNPLGARVECLYDDNWAPDPKAVLETVLRVLGDSNVQEDVMNDKQNLHTIKIPALDDEHSRLVGSEVFPGETAVPKEREASIVVSSEMAASLEAAMASGIWLLTISYKCPADGRFAHCWQTCDYPREDLIKTLDHLRAELAEKEANPMEVRHSQGAPLELVPPVAPPETDLTWK